MTKLEKVLLKKIKLEFPNALQNKTSIEVEYCGRKVRIDFLEQRIAGDQILNYNILLYFNEIEDVWYQYKELLNYSADYPATIWGTLKELKPEIYHAGYIMFSKIPDLNLETLSDEIVTFTKKSIQRYIDIVEVDKVVNDPNEDLQFSIVKYPGGAYRKILVARAANNPNATQIEADVRAWCNKWYEYGLKEDKVDMVNRKIVFDKIFGLG